MQPVFANMSALDEQVTENRQHPEKFSANAFPFGCRLKWLVTVLLVYFGARLLYFAINISPFVPPDEVTHLGLSQIFAKVFLLPDNSPATYEYGLVTNIPWLYYWLMGKLLPLNVFGISDLLFLRLLNIPFAFGTVYYAWRLLRLLTDNPYAQLLLVVAMTNTLMFTFLSASVSYDNLTNLLAAMAIYYLFAFFKDRSGHLLAASLICQLAGCLTKVSFLPLVLVLNLLLLVHAFRNFAELRASLADTFRRPVWRTLPLLLILLLGLALNVQLYGGNYLKYKKLNPEMTQVLPLEIAMQNRLAARGFIYKSFMEGKISYGHAMEMASQINHAGDRRDTMYLINNYARFKQSGAGLMSPLEYVIPWGQRMLASVYGIMGHISMLNTGATIIPVVVLLFSTVLAILIRFWSGDAPRLAVCLATIIGFYALVLLYAINYKTYINYVNFDIALQGRYIFPVIGPIYVISCYYLTGLFRNRFAKLGVLAAAALIFIALDFPYFLARVTPNWLY